MWILAGKVALKLMISPITWLILLMIGVGFYEHHQGYKSRDNEVAALNSRIGKLKASEQEAKDFSSRVYLSANLSVEAAEQDLANSRTKLSVVSTNLATKVKQIEELKRTYVPRAAVQLLIDSATTRAIKEHQPTTGPEQSKDDGTHAATSVADVIAVSVENNGKLLACGNQVVAWQGFYKNLYKSLEPSDPQPD